MAPGKDRPAMPTGAGRLRVVGFAAAVFAVALVAACSSSGGGSTSTNPDDGTTLTMWVRSATDQFSQRRHRSPRGKQNLVRLNKVSLQLRVYSNGPQIGLHQ